jgi:hypothetical protein
MILPAGNPAAEEQDLPPDGPQSRQERGPNRCPLGPDDPCPRRRVTP